MIKLVLLRHGESIWNREKRFTGWTDVDLTDKGVEEAKEAARLLKEGGYAIDIAFTSELIRATRTLDIVLECMGLKIPIRKSWRLNERSYGALQGLNKVEMTQKHGEEQVHIWRRSYDIRPPALEKDDPRWPGNDPKYDDVPKEDLPLVECLKDTVIRFLPYWEQEIVPELKRGRRIIIAAHGNSLRALVKHLDNVPEDEITSLNIPTGIPLIYELDDDLHPIRHYYLGDPEKVKAAAEAVLNQAKS